ncbi:two component system response regulator [Caballeronia calidae]|uniref:Two component system response regulator n=1 Tax=Caballeronia calidae TaxID=1777139 RepID=A0A158EKA4_9BURK|nr:response regulator transcription factor [Caballeronia calidae]SAL07322.1 two component system response regulator [Caballeronia calidae]
MKIAILEDDSAQADFERNVLSAAGHGCEVYGEAHALIADLRRKRFDLLLLDWNLPDIPGTTVLRWVRRHLSWHLPVLFVTNHDHGADIEAMLNAGADDYAVKPVTAGLLNARVNALLRRARLPASATDEVTFGDVVFNLSTRRVHRYGQLVSLTPREFDLALLLFQRMGQLVLRHHILATMGAREGEVPAHLVDTHVSMMRLKLELNPEHGYRLRAAFGYGYRLEPIVSGDAPSLTFH